MAPQRRIRLILRRQGQLEDDAARQQRLLLAAVRRAIVAALGEASAFETFRLTAMLAEVDRAIAASRAGAEAAATASVRRAWAIGTELTDGVLGDRARGIIGLSQELLSAAIEVTTDQVRDVWGELGSRLKTTIRRAALGVDDPFRAARALARAIRDPKTFGRAQARAEAIVRTEVNRVFSMATQQRLNQAAQAGVEVKKYWLTAGDQRVRPAHVEAGRAYGPSEAIPHDRAYVVDGERLMFPLDPRGSAENTINCRCASVPLVVEG